MTLKDLLASAVYRDYVLALDAHLEHQRFDHDAAVEPVIVALHEGWLEHAGTTPIALRELITTERLQTFNYIAQKLVAFSEAEGGADNIVNEAATLHMPIGHLVEYLVLRDESSDITAYLRKIRMPSARAYAARVSKMFRAASMNLPGPG